MFAIRRNQQWKTIILWAMPLYAFSLHNGHRLDEQEATELLPDDEAAREEAL